MPPFNLWPITKWQIIQSFIKISLIIFYLSNNSDFYNNVWQTLLNKMDQLSSSTHIIWGTGHRDPWRAFTILNYSYNTSAANKLRATRQEVKVMLPKIIHLVNSRSSQQYFAQWRIKKWFDPLLNLYVCSLRNEQVRRLWKFYLKKKKTQKI